MRALVRSVWDEPRPPDAPVRVWRDWLLVAVLVSAALLEGLLRPELDWRGVQFAVAVGLVPTLLWRRTRPLSMVVIAFGVNGLAQLAIGGPLDMDTLVYMILLPYSVCRWGSGREAVLGAAIMFGGVSFSAALGHVGPGDLVPGLAVVAAAVASGTAVRYRAADRVRRIDQVRLLERERLARDLHDTVAHHVSAMAIRAQAGLATAAARPEAATDALRVIEEEAKRALAEMRAMVHLLRVELPAPTPRVADLARHTGPGPVVDVGVDGDLDDVAPAIAAATYRLAQESITNARRHAVRATRIEVRVTVDDAAVHLRVSDDGELSSAAARPGFGLRGMIERVGLLGGTCEAGPTPGRGWRVDAVVPR